MRNVFVGQFSSIEHQENLLQKYDNKTKSTSVPAKCHLQDSSSPRIELGIFSSIVQVLPLCACVSTIYLSPQCREGSRDVFLSSGVKNFNLPW